MTPAPPRHHPSPEALLAYAGGQSDPHLRLLVEVHLEACDACAREAGAWAEPGGALLQALAPAPVPADLFARIQAALPRGEAADAGLPAAVARLLPPAPRRRWRGVLRRGIRFLELLEVAGRDSALYLLHLRDGAAFPDHAHAGLEQAVILAGGARDGAVQLEPGDWHAMAPGSRHAPRAQAGEDCWLLVRVEGRLAFRGWRGLLAGR